MTDHLISHLQDLLETMPNYTGFVVSGDKLTREPFTPSAGNLWAQPGVSDFEFIAAQTNRH